LFSLEDRYSPAPTNKVMNDDTKNAAQSHHLEYNQQIQVLA